MDKARKTEIVDEHIFKVLTELNEKYKGEIKMVSDSDYYKGRIVIQIKE